MKNIMLSAFEMILITNGNKRQHRIALDESHHTLLELGEDTGVILTQSPLGGVGELLRVLEPFSLKPCFDSSAWRGHKMGYSEWVNAGQRLEDLPESLKNPSSIYYEANSHKYSIFKDPSPEQEKDNEIQWLDAVNMPDWASRMVIAVNNISIERLQSISKRDALAEGLLQLPVSGRFVPYEGAQYVGMVSHDYLEAYSIMRADWDLNPYVLAIQFEVVKECYC